MQWKDVYPEFWRGNRIRKTSQKQLSVCVDQKDESAWQYASIAHIGTEPIWLQLEWQCEWKRADLEE